MEKLTLADIKMGLDPMGLVAQVIDVLSTSGSLTEDGIWVPTNAIGVNLTPRTAFEPSGEFRRPNRGVRASKGGLTNIEDYVAYLEDMSLVDDAVIQKVKKGQKQAARLQYDSLFTTGMAKRARTLTIYGDRSADVDSFNGWDTKRSVIDNVLTLDAASAGDPATRTSIYVVAWNSKMGCSYLYPQETAAGLRSKDFGLQMITDPNDSTRILPMWMTWFYQDLGFVVKDDRALIRIANVDPTDVTEAYYKKILGLLNQALRKINFSPDTGNIRIYGNQSALLMFDNMEHTLANFNLDPITLKEKTFIQSYRGVPLRECEEITSAEVKVV